MSSWVPPRRRWPSCRASAPCLSPCSLVAHRTGADQLLQPPGAWHAPKGVSVKFGAPLGQRLSWEVKPALLEARVTQRAPGKRPCPNGSRTAGETEARGWGRCPPAGRRARRLPCLRPCCLPSPAIRLFPSVRRMFAGGSQPALCGWRRRSWAPAARLGAPPSFPRPPPRSQLCLGLDPARRGDAINPSSILPGWGARSGWVGGTACCPPLPFIRLVLQRSPCWWALRHLGSTSLGVSPQNWGGWAGVRRGHGPSCPAEPPPHTQHGILGVPASPGAAGSRCPAGRVGCSQLPPVVRCFF